MADLTRLLQGLESYASALDRHSDQVQSDFRNLQRALDRLSAVYEGAGARDFKAHWAHSQQGLNDYVAGTKKIRGLLNQRIDRLRQADQSSGL